MVGVALVPSRLQPRKIFRQNQTAAPANWRDSDNPSWRAWHRRAVLLCDGSGADSVRFRL